MLASFHIPVCRHGRKLRNSVLHGVRWCHLLYADVTSSDLLPSDLFIGGEINLLVSTKWIWQLINARPSVCKTEPEACPGFFPLDGRGCGAPSSFPCLRINITLLWCARLPTPLFQHRTLFISFIPFLNNYNYLLKQLLCLFVVCLSPPDEGQQSCSEFMVHYILHAW